MNLSEYSGKSSIGPYDFNGIQSIGPEKCSCR